MSRKIALLSVFNKHGIVEFAEDLIGLGFDIVGSAGTVKKLSEAGIKAKDVASLIGGGPILGHKVATLSREIHAGLLAYNDEPDLVELESLGLPFIDLVYTDFYPLKEAIAKFDDDPMVVRTNTDIGGPALARSAAKGRRIVICDVDDCEWVIDRLNENGDLSGDERNLLAAKAEYLVAQYCMLSAHYISKGGVAGIFGERKTVLRYGENPYQTGAGLFSLENGDPLAIDKFDHIAGNPMGFINYTDLHRALEVMTRVAATFAANDEEVPHIAIGLKHGNTYGGAFDFSDPLEALRKMIEGNPGDLFGSFIMTNFSIGLEEAKIIRYHKLPKGLKSRTIDGLVAPSITQMAAEKLKRKDGACHFLENEALDDLSLDTAVQFRYVRGGFLQQPASQFVLNLEHPHPELRIEGELTHDHELDLMFAAAICQCSTSNTITLVNDQMLIGNGTCRGSRVRAAQVALQEARKNGHSTIGSVAVSDSFFPFTDGPKTLIKAGVAVIYATLGSKNDQAVIDCIKKSPATFVTLPNSVGRMFAGH